MQQSGRSLFSPCKRIGREAAVEQVGQQPAEVVAVAERDQIRVAVVWSALFHPAAMACFRVWTASTATACFASVF